MSFVHRNNRLALGDWVNYAVLLMISLVSVFPFIYMFSVSFTDPSVYVPLKFYLFPEKWSFSAYSYILSNDSFLNALKSTLFITVIGTILNLIFTFSMAYGLIKKDLPARGFIMTCVIFTLVFSAGLVPNYLLVKEFGLINSYWALIWPNLTNAWSIIVVKSFMDSLPEELMESARIDGCNELGVFFKIIIPLSKPALAAFTLFFAVAHWNTYFNALVYLTDHTKWTLQLLVKSLVMDAGAMGGTGEPISEDGELPLETIRMAAIMMAMAPILVMYPFLQKYFAKGVMLGSVKG